MKQRGAVGLVLSVMNLISALAARAARAAAAGTRDATPVVAALYAEHALGLTRLAQVMLGDGWVSRVDTLCLDVPPAQFEGECAFWAALTGQAPQPAPVPGFSYLTGPTGAGMPVRLLLQRLDEAAPGQRVRGHLDFGCTDRDAAVAWHVDHGARVTGTFRYWTVLADPAGHEYCLVGRRPWA